MVQTPDQLLADLLERLDALHTRDFSGLDAILQRADMVLRRTFGDDTEYRARLKRIHFSPMMAPVPEEVKNSSWSSGVQALRNLLNTAVEERLLFGVENPPDLRDEMVSQDEGTGGRTPTVFIVHGHDELAKTKVARFLEKLGCRTIVLHEQPNKGRTIIEKFEQESAGADFAVVLLTADDNGAALGKPLQLRARQNVVLELGYFVGRLGRDRVAALSEAEVELPGDYDGVVWISLSDDWRLELAKEMKSVGIPIDLNDAV